MTLKDLVDKAKQSQVLSDGQDDLRNPAPVRRATRGRVTEYERVDPEEIEKAEAAHRRDPEDRELQFLLAFLLYASRRYNAAVKHFTELLAKDYKSSQLRFHLGSCFYQLGRKPEARVEWERCLEAGPEQSIERLVRRRLEWFKVPERATPA